MHVSRMEFGVIWPAAERHTDRGQRKITHCQQRELLTAGLDAAVRTGTVVLTQVLPGLSRAAARPRRDRRSPADPKPCQSPR